MPTVQPEAIAGLVVDLGPPQGTTVSQWVALAANESSNNTEARNSCCTGLWQIHKVHAGKGGSPSNQDEFRNWLENPYNNYQLAKIIYAEQGWPAWEASHTPTARSNRAAAEPSVEGARALLAYGPGGASALGLGDVNPFDILDPITDPIANALRPLMDFVNMVADAAKWIGDPNNWTRIIQVGGGITLALVAASIVAKPVIEDAKRTVSPF